MEINIKGTEEEIAELARLLQLQHEQAASKICIDKDKLYMRYPTDPVADK